MANSGVRALPLEHTSVDVRPNGICIVYLNRPNERNAYSLRMAHELDRIFAEVDNDTAVKVVVLAGKGTHFCVGADLKGSFGDVVPSRDLGGVASLSVFQCSKPVIAALHGAAVGIGITLVLPCDIRIAEEDTIVGFIFASRGLSVEAASSYFLPRLVGMGRAAEWCMTARKFRAADERTSGLFSQVVPKGKSLDVALEMAEAMLAGSSQQSLVYIKRMLWSGLFASHPHDSHDMESLVIRRCYESEDMAEGFRSFLEKRPPAFPMKKEDMNTDELDQWTHWQRRHPPSKL